VISRVAEWRARAVLVLCGASLGLVLIEAAARIFLRPVLPPAPSLWEISPTLGWRNRPNSTLQIGNPRGEFASTITINAHGLRGPDLPYRATTQWRRLAIVGDSFAYGLGVDESETLAGRFAAALRPCRVDVLNGGNVGYSTDQEWLHYREEIQKYQPSETILLFFYNDLAPNLSREGTGRPKPIFVLRNGELELIAPRPWDTGVARPRTTALTYRQSALWHFAADRLSMRRADWVRTLARIGLAPAVSLGSRDEIPFGPMGGAEEGRVQEMWRVTAALLGRYRDDVRRGGGNFSVFYVPAPFEVNEAAWLALRRRFGLERPWRRDAVRAGLSRLLAGAEIPLFDVTESFRAAEANGPPAYFPIDGHWNARGHEIAFEALLPDVRRRLGCDANGGS
jgi:hypothetical protein